jgi:hypothetical protein
LVLLVRFDAFFVKVLWVGSVDLLGWVSTVAQDLDGLGLDGGCRPHPALVRAGPGDLADRAGLPVVTSGGRAQPERGRARS